MARNVIKKKAAEIDFFRSLSWLFALSTKLDICLQTSFQKKFPGICPYCMERVCCCFRTGKKPKVYRSPHKIIEEKDVQYQVVARLKKRNLASAVKDISSIYPNNEVIWHFSGPWMNCSKLFEEVAELHESIVKFNVGLKNRNSVEEEFADVFAWIISAWISLYEHKSLDEEFVSYFYRGCPVCESTPCACQAGNGRFQGTVDPSKFKELRVLFEELEEISPNAKVELEGLISSLKTVELEQTDVVANAVVNEASSKLERLNYSLEQTDAVAKKLSSISKAIAAITSLF